MTELLLPQWIELDGTGNVCPHYPRITDSARQIAQRAGLVLERFTIATQIGGPGIVLDYQGMQYLRPLAPARTITLLALIHGFCEFPVVTSSGLIMPHGGFCRADRLAAKIEELTEGTKLLFNPSPTEIRVAIRRLKCALGDILHTSDLIETVHGLGYRFRLCPSLIIVIISY